MINKERGNLMFNVLNFIILNESIEHERHEYKYSFPDQLLYPLNTPIPIIVKGFGCIGIGSIHTIILENHNNGPRTTIIFTMTQTPEPYQQAYYNLYRNTLPSMSNTDDIYENTDMLIPGFIQTKKQSPVNTKKSNRRRPSSFYDDDDY